MKGSYKIYEMREGEKQLVHQQNNLVMFGSDNGAGLITRLLAGDPTYPLTITSAAIGTGTATPDVSDTALETPVLSDIPIALSDQLTASLVLQFFIPDADLAQGNYTEFGLFAGTQLFARSVISPQYEKDANVDTVIEYTLTVTAN